MLLLRLAKQMVSPSLNDWPYTQRRQGDQATKQLTVHMRWPGGQPSFCPSCALRLSDVRFPIVFDKTRVMILLSAPGVVP